MGICCTGKLSKNEYKSDEITRSAKPPIASITTAKIEPILSFDTEKNPLNTNINLLIAECISALYKFKVGKINIDQLWNIIVNYKHDYTGCEYIIKDFRKEHPENFLKKFKQLNYSLSDLEIISHSKYDNFVKYLKNKKIICILENDNLDKIQKMIQYFVINEIELNSILFLDNNLVSDIPINSKNLLKTLDSTKVIEFYPYILLSLKNFPHIDSDSHVFIQQYNANLLNDLKFSPEFLSDSHTEKNKEFIEFCNEHKINVILRLGKGNFTHTKKEFKRKRLNNEPKNTSFFITMTFNSLSEEKSINEIDDLINTLKSEIENKSSILIQFEEGIESLIVEFSFLLMWKITNLHFEIMKDYFKLNNISFFNSLLDNDTFESNKKNEIMNILHLFEYKD